MKNPTDFAADVKTWLEFADYDLKTAKWEFEGAIYTSACYAAQQTAEKALKALILSQGQATPKIHSLDRLISDLKRLQLNVGDIEKPAQELDKYYISTRYPGQYGGPEGLYDKADAQFAIEAAETILNFVKKTINQRPK